MISDINKPSLVHMLSTYTGAASAAQHLLDSWKAKVTFYTFDFCTPWKLLVAIDRGDRKFPFSHQRQIGIEPINDHRPQHDVVA